MAKREVPATLRNLTYQVHQNIIKNMVFNGVFDFFRKDWRDVELVIPIGKAFQTFGH